MAGREGHSEPVAGGDRHADRRGGQKALYSLQWMVRVVLWCDILWLWREKFLSWCSMCCHGFCSGFVRCVSIFILKAPFDMKVNCVL